MITDKKPINEWKKILLDTSIICSLFRSQHNVENDIDTFTFKLIDYLSNSKTGDKSDRVYYISTITLSELLTREQDEAKIRKILKVLDSSNVEFRSFDTPTAMTFNILLGDKLHNPVLNKKAAELGWKTNEYMDAREWIIKDYMIAMTGVVKNVDAILTLDKTTFYPLCKDVDGANCILAYQQLFEYSDNFILNYDYDNIDNFILDKPFESLNEIEAAKPVPPTKPIQVNLFGEQRSIL